MSILHGALLLGGAAALAASRLVRGGQGGSRPGTSLVPAGEMPWLVDQGRVTRGLIRERVTASGRVTPHWGLDVAAALGTPVRALMPGRVLWTRAICGYGNTVALGHTDRLSTLYCHLDSATVAEGDQVVAGQQVGAVGRTTHCPDGNPPPDWAPGRAATMREHLHWEVHPRATPAFGERTERSDPQLFIVRNGFLASRAGAATRTA